MTKDSYESWINECRSHFVHAASVALFDQVFAAAMEADAELWSHELPEHAIAVAWTACHTGFVPGRYRNDR